MCRRGRLRHRLVDSEGDGRMGWDALGASGYVDLRQISYLDYNPSIGFTVQNNSVGISMGLTAIRLLLLLTCLALCQWVYQKAYTRYQAQRTQEQSAALRDALLRLDTRRVRQILRQGADPDTRGFCGTDNDTALQLSSRLDHVTMVKLLLAAGADTELRNASGQTALLLAARSGHLSAVRTLLSNGAVVDARGPMGETALIHAAARGDVKMVALLCRSGCNVSIQDEAGDTALQTALSMPYESQERRACARILLESGANPNVVNFDGQSLVAELQSYGLSRSARLLRQFQSSAPRSSSEEHIRRFGDSHFGVDTEKYGGVGVVRNP